MLLIKDKSKNNLTYLQSEQSKFTLRNINYTASYFFFKLLNFKYFRYNKFNFKAINYLKMNAFIFDNWLKYKPENLVYDKFYHVESPVTEKTRYLPITRKSSTKYTALFMGKLSKRLLYKPVMVKGVLKFLKSTKLIQKSVNSKKTDFELM
jgi:sensor histidine kinase YesM